MNKKKFTSIFLTLTIISALFFISRKNELLKSDFFSKDQVKVNYSKLDSNISFKVNQQNQDQLNSKSLNPCNFLKVKFEQEKKINNYKKNIRYINLHKNINGEIFRLREFFKETNENEKKVYLVYKENRDGEDVLIEKSDYTKGKLFLKTEKSAGEIIYLEEGIALGSSHDLFLRFENNKLITIKGIDSELNLSKPLDCNFR